MSSSGKPLADPSENPRDDPQTQIAPDTDGPREDEEPQEASGEERPATPS